MDLNELLRLLQAGESEKLEFKQQLPGVQDVAKSLAAFANTGGGDIVFGIDDKTGRVVGVTSADDVLKHVANALNNNCRPKPVVSTEILRFDEKFVVRAKVNAQTDQPVVVDSKIYVRSGPTSTPINDGRDLMRNFSKLGGTRRTGPPATTTDSVAPPPVPRGFRGRERELDSLGKYLQHDDVCLISIVGISGIGKTSLAAHFAASTVDSGYVPFWQDCYRETTFEPVCNRIADFARAQGEPTIADAIDAPSTHLGERLGQIADILARRRYCLFFNDYHVVVDPVMHQLVWELVRRARAIKLVLTARQRSLDLVRLDGTAEMQLQQGLDQKTCLTVLRDRGIEVSTADAGAVWRLSGEGHPYALKILAARAATVPIKQLIGSLPTFQEKLKEAWLLPLLNELPEEERSLVIDLSVFDRPLDPNSLPRLYKEKTATKLNELVLRLLDRFIVEFGLDGHLQFHPLIREYCYSLIANPAGRHKWAARFYEGECGQCEDPKLISEVQTASLLAAWSHWIKATEHTEATRIVLQLRSSLMNQGQVGQLKQLLDETRPSRPEDQNQFVIDRARILSLWGSHAEAVSLLEPLTVNEDIRAAREAILVLATVHLQAGRAAEALQVLEQYRGQFAGDAGPTTKVRYLRRLIEVYLGLGEVGRAKEYASQVKTLCDRWSDPVGGGIALRQLAEALHAQGQISDALILAEVSHGVLTDVGRVREAAISQQLRASILEASGDRSRAAECYGEACRVFEEIGDRIHSADCRQRLSALSNG